jgi:hypothetical protein
LNQAWQRHVQLTGTPKQDRDERQSNMVDWTGKRRPDKEAVEAGSAGVLPGTSSTPADG